MDKDKINQMAKPDATAILISFDLLSQENKRTVLSELNEIANRHGGSVTHMMNYSTSVGEVVLYQL